jgi:hypothetical protein
MTCDHAIERLPWLLNGTLEAAERDEVRHHLETCESCPRALSETREAWSVFAQHLPSQNLVALAWGETPSEVVEEHLASCARCAAELELVRMSRRLEEEDNIALFPAAKPRPAAVPRRWQAAAIAAGLAAVVSAFGWIQADRQADELSTRLARVEAPAGSLAPPPAGDTSSLRERIAGLEGDLKRLIGLQQENAKEVEAARDQVAKLESERALLARPQATAMVDLGSGDVMRAEEEAEERILKQDQYVTLLLTARGEGAVAKITDASGKVVWQASRLPVTDGYHSLVLPPGSLAPGRYTLRLSGRTENWTFQVVP